MQHKALTCAILLVAVALSGCSGAGGDDGSPFTIKKPDDPVTEPFVFKANVDADEYLWDFGDGRAPGSGKTAEHVYGFADGEVRVKLTAVTAGQKQEFPAQTLTIGTGENSKPSFQMDVSYNWLQVGETLTLSGAGSTDPDGDPLLFSFFCKRESDIGPVGPSHAHGPGGIAYGSSGADPIPVNLVNGTGLPAADREVEGDLCAGLAGGAFTEDATVSGAFEQKGIYKITMLAKDPKTPSLPGSVVVYVTDEPRQQAVETLTLSGDLDVGKPTSEQAPLDDTFCNENVDQCGHIADEPFELRYPILGFQASLSSDSDVRYAVMKSCSTAKTSESTDAVSEGADWLDKGTHCIRLFNREVGTAAAYEVTLTVAYQTDPAKLFEDPSGH